MSHAAGDRLAAVLERARAAGALGPGPVSTHLEHARGFVTVAERVLGRGPRSFADLGSGGGAPGLVLAQAWPPAKGALVDAMRRRVESLREAVTELGYAPRVEVLHGRAEDIARDPDRREAFELVTARGFDRPAITAEVAAGLVAPGGIAIVSEPPGGDPARWPAGRLAELGFAPVRIEQAASATFAVLAKIAPAPADIPRLTKALVKRPRW